MGCICQRIARLPGLQCKKLPYGNGLRRGLVKMNCMVLVTHPAINQAFERDRAAIVLSCKAQLLHQDMPVIERSEAQAAQTSDAPDGIAYAPLAEQHPLAHIEHAPLTQQFNLANTQRLAFNLNVQTRPIGGNHQLRDRRFELGGLRLGGCIKHSCNKRRRTRYRAAFFKRRTRAAIAINQRTHRLNRWL